MSGLVVIAFAGLLTQEAAPLPSTQTPYSAPVIRPYEPGRSADGDPAQGDSAGERSRAPLETPVTVEAYVRSYEYAATEAEAVYEQGVTSAEIRADQAAGQLDGTWRLVDAAGRTLYELVLNDPGIGPAEGGWRGRGGYGAASSDGRTLTLDGAGTMALERTATGWRGTLTGGGQTRAVSLVRPD